MIETDEQRRWWFATHPEYSRSRRGTKTRKRKAEEKEPEKVRPEEVDAYVDNALQYVSGPVAELLKSTKRNFGTEAEANSNELKQSGHATGNRTTHDKHTEFRFRKYSNEELRRMGIPTPEEEALVSDPHTFLDLFPYRRFITAPIKAFRGLLWSWARGSVLSAAKKKGTPWKRGQGLARPSRTLAGKLEKAGRPRPRDHDAHHIVPAKDERFPEAIKARKILEKFNIDSNDAANGVWLPSKPGIGSGAYHRAIHGGEYYRRVLKLLREAKTRRGAIRILKQMGRQLSNNTFFQ